MKLFQIARSPYWYVDLRAYRHGKKSTGETDRVQAGLAASRLLIALGVQDAPASTITVGDWILRYLAWCETTKTPAVVQRERPVLERFQARVGTNTLLSAITRAQIERYRQDRATTPRTSPQGTPLPPVGPATINRDVSAIRHCFSQAVDQGVLTKSPCVRLKGLRAPAPLPQYYREAEIAGILKASPAYWANVWRLFLYTGMRLGEVTALTVDDVTDVIRVRHPKEGREKIVPIADELVPALTKLRKAAKTGRLVPYGERWIKRRFTVALTKAGLAGSLHRLRHSVITHLLLKGVPVHVVQRLVGHRDIRSTMKYTHLLPKHLKTAVGRLRW